jgi:hypothetical protein
MTSAPIASGSMAIVSRAAIAPQQADQPLTRLSLAAAAQQHRQDRLRLAGGQRERRPIRPERGKSTQHVHPNAHRTPPCRDPPIR